MLEYNKLMEQTLANLYNTEIFAINYHIALCQHMGDSRPEQEILLEWIEGNAELLLLKPNLVISHKL